MSKTPPAPPAPPVLPAPPASPTHRSKGRGQYVGQRRRLQVPLSDLCHNARKNISHSIHHALRHRHQQCHSVVCPNLVCQEQERLAGPFSG